MASTDARPVPRKNVAYRHYFAIRKNDGTLITTWAGMDSELSKDGANFVDATNEATEIQTSGCGYIDIDSGEMNYDCVTVKVTVTNTDALPYVVNLFPEESGDIRTDMIQASGSTSAADALELFALALSSGALTSSNFGLNSITASAIASGAIDADAIATDAIDAAALKADAVTEIAAGVLGATTSSYTDPGTVGEIIHYIGVSGASLTALGGMSTTMKGQVKTEAASSLSDIHLDHLFSTTYDPASKPGAADALLNELVESDAGVSRYTANALEQAPSGTGASAATIADAVWDEAQADHVAAGSFGETATETAAIKLKTDNLPTDPADASVIAAAFAEIKGGTWSSATDTLEAIRDELTTIEGYVDLIDDGTSGLAKIASDAAAIKLKTDNLPTDPADASIIAASFAALPTAVENADALMIRASTNWEGTASAYSLGAMVLASLNSSVSALTMTVKKADGTTFDTYTVTEDATANPITSVKEA